MFNQENINQLMQEHLNSEDIKEYINENLKELFLVRKTESYLC